MVLSYKKAVKTFIAIALMCLSTKAIASTNFTSSKYRVLSNKVLSDKNLDFLVHSSDFDVKENKNIRVKIDASKFLKDAKFPASIKVSVFRFEAGKDLWLQNVSKTILSERHASKLYLSLDLDKYMTTTQEEFIFKVYSEEGNLIGEFSDSFVVDNFEPSYEDINESVFANCEGEEFNSCHMDHILQNLEVKLVPKIRTESTIAKNSKGSYLLEIPALSTKKSKKRRQQLRKRRKSSISTTVSSVEEQEIVNKSSNSSTNALPSFVSQKVSSAASGSDFMKARPMSKFSVNEGTHNFDSARKTFMAGGDFNVTDVGNYSAIFGKGGKVKGDYSLSAGLSNDVTGLYTAVFGKANESTGSYSVVTGGNNINHGEYTLVTGRLNETGMDAYGSFVSGYGNSANGNFSTVMGANNFVDGYAGMAFGRYLTNKGDGTIVMGSGLPGNPYVTEEDNAFIIVHGGQEVMVVKSASPEFPNGIIDTEGSVHSNGGFIGPGTGLTNIPASSIVGIIQPSQGGTGIANNGTMSWGSSNISYIGGNDIIFRTTADTDITLPSYGVLVTEDGFQTLRNKTIIDSTLNGVSIVHATVGTLDFGSGGEIKGNITYSGTQTYSSSVTINGNFTLNDGSQKDGYILSTDANGNSTWVDIATVINNSNQGIVAEALAAGNNGEVQFNINDGLQASANLVFLNDVLTTTKVHITNGFTYRDGTETLGYVLTTNANGDASWVDPNTLTGAKAAGDNGEIQFNDHNGFAASEDLKFEDSTLIAKAIVFKDMKQNAATSTLALDWSEGNQQEISMNEDALTLSIAKDPKGPATVLVQINHNANAVTKTITWPDNFLFSEGSPPLLSDTANAIDFITCFYNPNHNTKKTYFCQASYNFN